MNTEHLGSKRDYIFGIAAGFLIGLLLMPVLQTANPVLYESLKLKLILIPIFTVLVPIGLVIASWIGQRFSIIWQLAKFIVIGVLNTLVDLGALAFMFSLAYLTGAAIASSDILLTFVIPITFFILYKSLSFIVANINSYFWNKYWTFGTENDKKTSTEFTQFFLVSLIGFIINVSASSFIFSFFHKIGGLTADQWGLIGGAIGSISGLAWNFIGYKFIVFKEPEEAV
jgi:putative flippase GtrA